MNDKLIIKKFFQLSKWSRPFKELFMIIVDSIAIITVLLGSFSLRLGDLYFPSNEIVFAIFGAPLIAIPIFYSLKLYRLVVRYIGLQSLWKVIQAISLYSAIWGIMIYIASIGMSFESFKSIPKTVILINWMLTILVIGGLRLLAKWIFNPETRKKNVIIYGAGSAGRQLSFALNQSDEYKLVCFIDDSSSHQQQTINGIKIFSPSHLDKIISKKNISEVLIAIPSITRTRRNEIILFLEAYNVLVRSLPAVADLIGGKLKIEDLRKVEIKDLLGRKPVIPNSQLMNIKIKNKVVLVTGAGGSIGSELSRQIIQLEPKIIVLFEVSEPALYHIEQKLKEINKNRIEIIGILGSVRNYEKLERILSKYQVQTVYHAAAYKHVPIVENNKTEGVLNNVIGTWRVAEASISANVETFVLVSTDKAVRPTNTMGATKRVSELILQALALNKSNTCFTMVRFGNVLDSSGSVIPLFKKQIKNGGPVTVTDKKIVRYFMTVQEAVELIIQAGAMAKGGDVFVLDMGKPVLINDLARKIINLSGLQVRDDLNPDGDIEIKYVGLRPGEKLYEELLIGDNVSKTKNTLIMRAKESMMVWSELEPLITELESLSLKSQNDEVQSLLKQLVPDFKPNFK
jgi:FlaA1/EpsC-like NDP-sugar epimerase